MSENFLLVVMLKARHLCTGAKSNLRDRVLGEVEKNSFIALSGKGGHSRLLPSKTMCSNPGEFDKEFYGNGSRVELLIRLGCVQGLHSSNLVSGNLFFFNFFGVYLFYLFIYGCVGSSFLCEGFL